MTTLEKLALLVENIPAAKREAFQSELGEMAQDYIGESGGGLSAEQEAEDKRRFADPNPTYASQNEIDAIWGKALPS